jgi:dihydrofolate reductase
MTTRLIAALDERRGMGGPDGIPWQGKIPTDVANFRDRTAEGIVLMGYRTYEEFDAPLHRRDNFVWSRPGGPPMRPGFEAVVDAREFLADRADQVVWVIGGAGLFVETLPVADELYLTQLEGDFGCTTFFPSYDDGFDRISVGEDHVEHDIRFHFEVWRSHRPA